MSTTEEHPRLFRNTAGSSGATETPANAPKCDWRTKDATGNESICGDQKGKLYKVTRDRGMERQTIPICEKHRVDAWGRFKDKDPVIEPL